MLRTVSSGTIAGCCCGMLRITAGRLVGKDGRDAERVTTTLTRARKLKLDRLARREGVKVAWVVRRAVELYLDAARGGPPLPLDFGKSDAQR